MLPQHLLLQEESQRGYWQVLGQDVAWGVHVCQKSKGAGVNVHRQSVT